MEATIERELDVELVVSPERSVTVPARLEYRTDDPYAVHFAFHVGSDCPVSWAFARELLIDGLFRPCGQGDVRVWPTRRAGQLTVSLVLGSPDGDALIEVPGAAVSSWLERTLRAVSPGREGELMDMEAGLGALLSSGREG